MKLELTKRELEGFHMQRDRFQASTYNLINGMMLVGFLHMGPNQIIRAIIIKAEGDSFDQFRDPVVEYRAKLRDAAVYIDVDHGRLPELGYKMCDFLDNVRENWRLVDVSAIYDWVSRIHEARKDGHNPYLHDGFTLSELADIVSYSDGQSSFLDNFERHITIIDEKEGE